MEVVHRLAPVFSLVQDEPVSVCETLLLRDDFRRIDEMLVISLGGNSCRPWDLGSGDDDDADASAWGL
jgi:hypothetical protein